MSALADDVGNALYVYGRVTPLGHLNRTPDVRCVLCPTRLAENPRSGHGRWYVTPGFLVPAFTRILRIQRNAIIHFIYLAILYYSGLSSTYQTMSPYYTFRARPEQPGFRSTCSATTISSASDNASSRPFKNRSPSSLCRCCCWCCCQAGASPLRFFVATVPATADGDDTSDLGLGHASRGFPIGKIVVAICALFTPSRFLLQPPTPVRRVGTEASATFREGHPACADLGRARAWSPPLVLLQMAAVEGGRLALLGLLFLKVVQLLVVGGPPKYAPHGDGIIASPRGLPPPRASPPSSPPLPTVILERSARPTHLCPSS